MSKIDRFWWDDKKRYHWLDGNDENKETIDNNRTGCDATASERGEQSRWALIPQACDRRYPLLLQLHDRVPDDNSHRYPLPSVVVIDDDTENEGPVMTSPSLPFSSRQPPVASLPSH